MPDPNEPPARPSRLIVPGAEREPAEPPRIILPPGTSVETHDDLPEYPRLRPVQIAMVRDEGGRDLLLVRDPIGVTQDAVFGMEALDLLQLLDGTTSLTDLQAMLMRDSKDLRVGNILREFIAKLDDLLLLRSPKFEAAMERLQAEWHPLEVRPAALEGVCYPAEREPLEKFLDEQFAFVAKRAEEPGAVATGGAVSGGATPGGAAGTLPRAILAPHLDPRREGHVSARAYMEIGESGHPPAAGPGADPGAPLRVVVFGTGHNLSDEFVALTRKRFETPLGQVPCDTAFVDRVAAALGERAYRRELVHRDEHSIEFQVIYLQRRLGARPWKLVPILCGGFHRLLDDGKTPRDEPVIETLVSAVRDAEATLGGPTLYVAGVDFSHVGPRFNDAKLDEETADLVQRIDEHAIAAAATGDADAWFQAIAEVDDRTRICGFAPTYCMLRAAAPGAGRPLAYAGSPEPDGTIVTVAAMAWP